MLLVDRCYLQDHTSQQYSPPPPPPISVPPPQAMLVLMGTGTREGKGRSPHPPHCPAHRVPYLPALTPLCRCLCVRVVGPLPRPHDSPGAGRPPLRRDTPPTPVGAVTVAVPAASGSWRVCSSENNSGGGVIRSLNASHAPAKGAPPLVLTDRMDCIECAAVESLILG